TSLTTSFNVPSKPFFLPELPPSAPVPCENLGIIPDDISDCVCAPLNISSPRFKLTSTSRPLGAYNLPSRRISSCVAPPKPLPGPRSFTIPTMSWALAPFIVPAETLAGLPARPPRIPPPHPPPPVLILIVGIFFTPIAPSTLLRQLTTPLTTEPSRLPKLLPIEDTPSTALCAIFLIADPIRPGSSFAPLTILSNVFEA